jgi:recombinase-like zinc beta ribbon protein
LLRFFTILPMQEPLPMEDGQGTLPARWRVTVLRRRRKPREEWLQIKQDVYPAYISWEEYLLNQERLKSNALDFNKRASPSPGAQGVPRDGEAVLQGLVVCGVCGHRLRVAYKKVPRYLCNTEQKHMQGPMCLSVPAPPLDEAVVRAFFEALRPAQLDALEAVLADQEAEYRRLLLHWEERVKRARYTAQLAQRQYSAVDPDNRLVAVSPGTSMGICVARASRNRRSMHTPGQKLTPDASASHVTGAISSHFRNPARSVDNRSDYSGPAEISVTHVDPTSHCVVGDSQ